MPKVFTQPQALTIATSDSGGGAGIQGDIKAMAANGAFGLSVVVAITAQNTTTVSRIFALPRDIIEAQLDAVFDDFAISAVKTGMLHSAEIVRTVADRLRSRVPLRLVVDPVMRSSTGAALLEPDAVKILIHELLPLAEVVTPNVPEAEALTGMRIATIDDARAAAARIHQHGSRAVLIKGGHLAAAPATDVLFDGVSWTEISGEWLDSPHTHGTGCAYSAAITARLAQGADLVTAVKDAKTYITEAIRHGLAIGHGHGPMNLLFRLDQGER
jgi:hydroxymethylpyrimidine/phosphomethylpyrimidine kinase